MAGGGRDRVRSRRLAIDVEPLLPILEDAAHLYVAVSTPSGPHVTPELFTISGDRLVCLTAASTLKVKRLRRDPVAGIAARSAAGSFTARARVEVLDPINPMTAVRSPLAAASSPVDVARFVRDNAVELSGAAVDALSGRLGVPPTRRVMLALAIEAATRVDADGRSWSDGWASRGTSSGADDDDDDEGEPFDPIGDDELDLDDLPAELSDVVAPSDVVLGWSRADDAPLALPGRWDGGSVTVPRAFFDEPGAVTESPASVTFDEWTGLGPSGKQGVMLRGRGRAAAEDDSMRVELDIDRAAHWVGIETATIEVEGSS